MKNFLYRFRSLDRLLGKDGELGELEKLEIFFSEPSQLNDPLEGYKDIFWAGDSITWHNLFRHYITCLVQHLFLHLIAIAGDEPIDSRILIRNHGNSLPEGVEELIESAYRKLMGYTEIKNYIGALADFRKIRLEDLIFHFNVLHRVALHSALSEFEAKKLLPFSSSDVIADLEKDLLACKETTVHFPQDDESVFAASLYEKAYGYMLGAKIEHMRDKQHQNWFFIMAEFPETFCKSLEELTHPSWYTACFMDDCTNSSVWGSYGANHTGVCLVYDAPLSTNGNPTMTLKIPVGEGREGLVKDFVTVELHKVDYQRRFVQIDFFNSLGSLPIPTLNRYWYTDIDGNRSSCGADIGSAGWRQSYWKSVMHANTTKLKDWEFEREYRAILQPSVLDLSARDTRACSYDFESLHGVIFGIKTPAHQKVRTIELVRMLCARHARNDFSFYQARYNPRTNSISHYKINIEI